MDDIISDDPPSPSIIKPKFNFINFNFSEFVTSSPLQKKSLENFVSQPEKIYCQGKSSPSDEKKISSHSRNKRKRKQHYSHLHGKKCLAQIPGSKLRSLKQQNCVDCVTKDGSENSGMFVSQVTQIHNTQVSTFQLIKQNAIDDMNKKLLIKTIDGIERTLKNLKLECENLKPSPHRRKHLVDLFRLLKANCRLRRFLNKESDDETDLDSKKYRSNLKTTQTSIHSYFEVSKLKRNLPKSSCRLNSCDHTHDGKRDKNYSSSSQRSKSEPYTKKIIKVSHSSPPLPARRNKFQFSANKSTSDRKCDTYNTQYRTDDRKIANYFKTAYSKTSEDQNPTGRSKFSTSSANCNILYNKVPNNISDMKTLQAKINFKSKISIDSTSNKDQEAVSLCDAREFQSSQSLFLQDNELRKKISQADSGYINGTPFTQFTQDSQDEMNDYFDIFHQGLMLQPISTEMIDSNDFVNEEFWNTNISCSADICAVTKLLMKQNLSFTSTD